MPTKILKIVLLSGSVISLTGGSIGLGLYLTSESTLDKLLRDFGLSNSPNKQSITQKDIQNIKTAGQISTSNTTEDQWKFLHKLADKVFQYLKTKGKNNNKEDLIDWLKSKFSKESSEDESWKNFKTLCTLQLSSEPKLNLAIHQEQSDSSEDSGGNTSLNKEESRLCFMGSMSDSTDNSKSIDDSLAIPITYGNLSDWDNSESYSSLGFDSWPDSNWGIWSEFNKYSVNENDKTQKFQEWYDSTTSTSSKESSDSSSTQPSSENAKKIKEILSKTST